MLKFDGNKAQYKDPQSSHGKVVVVQRALPNTREPQLRFCHHQLYRTGRGHLEKLFCLTMKPTKTLSIVVNGHVINLSIKITNDSSDWCFQQGKQIALARTG